MLFFLKNLTSTLLILLLLIGTMSFGQNQIDSVISLQEVNLKALKIRATNNEIPRGVSKVEVLENQSLTSQISLGEYLGLIPGLFSLNQNNFAQDIRVSIRGFGSRAAFGIRGVKLVVDGIPETTPDGQGQVDNVPLGLLKDIEVLRGPSASLYGNAAGGVLYLTTIDSLENHRARLRFVHGAFGLNSLKATIGLKNDKTSAVLYQNLTNSEGYRQNSGFKQRVFNTKVIHQFSKKSVLRSHLNFTHSPDAEDAGGLTLTEYNENRKQARKRNLQYDTHEKISHFKIGSNWTYDFNNMWSLLSSGYYSFRDFFGKLPFQNGGIVSLDRNYFGLTSQISFQKQNMRMQLGWELHNQNDDRLRYENVEGVQGTKMFDQTEIFASNSLYWAVLWNLNKLKIQGGIGYDRQIIGASSIESNSLHNSLNPNLGIGLKSRNHLIFSHVSKSYQTPTLSELSANLSEEGLNVDLEPSKAWNYEIGWKTQTSNAQFELVFYHITTSNEIVPYEIESYPNRSFYRNSGKTHRTGLELFYNQEFNHIIGSLAYSYSSFTFQNYIVDREDLSGNLLPGLPVQQLNFQLQSHDLGLWKLFLKGSIVSKLFADDSNKVPIRPYQVIDLTSSREFKAFGTVATLMLGIQNLLNKDYSDNIRINAFGGRYYEPAPLRTFYAGFSVDI